jgi:putative membrane protein
MELAPYVRVFASTAFYTLFWIIVFAIAFKVIVKISPFSIRKEIEEDQNTALAVVIASVILGLSIIIAAAIHG